MSRKKAERAHLYVVRDGNVLRPRTKFDADLLSRFAHGKPLEADLIERHNEGRMRLYWSVLHAVIEATGKWANEEAMHWALKIRLGFIDEIASVDGEVIIRAKSIAFDRMEESERKQYFDAAMAVITEDVVPGMTIEELLDLGKKGLEPGVKQ